MEPGSRGMAGADQVGGSRTRTLRVKMVLLGSTGVGKSSLALRFSRDTFTPSTSSTMSCAYMTRDVHLGDATLHFEIWDTAGQEKYHSITPLYYRGAHAALVVYDISQRETFIRAQMWLRELEKQYVPGSTVLILVGNKEDLTHMRQVTTKEGLSLAKDRDILFIETSSLSGNQVNELLLTIAHRVNSMLGGQPRVFADWQQSHPVELRHNDTFRTFSYCCPNA